MNFARSFDSTVQGLKKLGRGGHVNLLSLDPLVVDALRGSLWELKERRTLTDFLQSESPERLISLALKRLKSTSIAPTVPSQPHPNTFGNVGLGTYGWKYDLDVIRAGTGAGIRLIDTAESYGYGRAEKRLGEGGVLGDVTIATKVSRNHTSYQAVINAARRSAKALGKIPDLYQLHWPVVEDLEDSMRAMGDLLQLEEIGSVGLCNCSIDLIESAQSFLPNTRIRSVQVRYSLIDRGIERALLPYCHGKDIDVIAYSPLGQDFRRLQAHPGWGTLAQVAKATGVTEAMVALSWVMGKGAIPIARTNNPRHAEEIALAANILLTTFTIRSLDRAFPPLE